MTELRFTHNSDCADSEPSWGSVDKTKLPRMAFADKGDAAKKSTWGYPHHWVQNGGSPDDMGCDTTGKMFLHKGGLNAAWAAAMGAHTGKKADSEVISHLESHRKALGLDKKSATPGVEHRFLGEPIAGIAIEMRDGKPRIIGTAAVFYDGTPKSEFELWQGVRERIVPGAFDRALAEKDDVRALFNHDPNLILGRTPANTLKLAVSARGLGYEIDPPDTSYAKDLLESLRRHDVTGSSFGFQVTDQAWIEGPDVTIREIRSVSLFDISPATYPAYTATTAGVRTEGADEAWSAFEAWRSSMRLKRLADARARFRTYLREDELNKAKRRL